MIGPTLSKIGGMETSFSSWMGKTTLLSLSLLERIPLRDCSFGFERVIRLQTVPVSDDFLMVEPLNSIRSLNSKQQVKSD